MSNKDTVKRVKAIKKRLEAITPGPWHVTTFVNLFEVHDKHWSRIHNGRDNREFIAHAPEDLAFLLQLLGEDG